MKNEKEYVQIRKLTEWLREGRCMYATEGSPRMSKEKKF